MFAMLKNIVLNLSKFELILLLTVFVGNKGLAQDNIDSQISENQKALTKKVRVAYYGKVSHENFEKNVLVYFRQINNSSTQKIELVNQLPESEDGLPDYKLLHENIKSLSSDFAIIYFDANRKFLDSDLALIQDIEQKIAQGHMFICFSGLPQKQEPSIALSKSLCGKISNAIIIGELTERERLLPQGFFGPEMLTAIKPSKEYLGQGLAPLQFVYRLANKWHLRKSSEWIQHFNEKKIKNKKLWASLEDFF